MIKYLFLCREENPKIGDILTQAAPFLKMYSLYVQNFHEAMTVIKHWSEKSHNFANIIKQTQAMEECGNLSLEVGINVYVYFKRRTSAIPQQGGEMLEFIIWCTAKISIAPPKNPLAMDILSGYIQSSVCRDYN